MKTLTVFETHDGKRHDSHDEALRHLDRIYSDALTKAAHALCAATDGKYGKTAEWLNANLGRFQDLSAIKADMQLIEDAE